MNDGTTVNPIPSAKSVGETVRSDASRLKDIIIPATVTAKHTNAIARQVSPVEIRRRLRFPFGLRFAADEDLYGFDIVQAVISAVPTND